MRWLLDEGDGDDARNSAYTKPDGTFLIDNVTRTPLSLTVFSLPSGWCVISAVFGTQNVLEDGLQFPGPEQTGKDTLQIKIGPGAATIEGVVLHGDAPIPDALVKLFQMSSGAHKTPIRTLRSEYTKTNTEGHFVFTDLSPGRYRALAYADEADEDGSPPEGDADFIVARKESKALKFKLPKTEE